MSIRKYRESDLSAVLSAWENAQCLAHPFLSEDFQAQEKKNVRDLYLPNVETWVIEVDGVVVGFVSLIQNEIGGLFLQPTHIGKNFGKMLVDKALEFHNELIVEVFEKNIVGRKFYAKYGFRFVAEKTHEQTGERVFRLRFLNE
ncbi:GNAT family N-acetyltransferase [bacterium]|nr:GNAT family N-acetyltransferase [bacterium]NUN46892.1 GNAT family N-acetyltransferase [bacterium]